MPNDHRGRDLHGGKVTDDFFRSQMRSASVAPSEAGYTWEVANADNVGTGGRPYNRPPQAGHKMVLGDGGWGSYGRDISAKGTASTEMRANIAAESMARRIAMGGVDLQTGRPVVYPTSSPDIEPDNGADLFDDYDDPPIGPSSNRGYDDE
jgi:hypothetical protein